MPWAAKRLSGKLLAKPHDIEPQEVEDARPILGLLVTRHILGLE